MTEFKPLGIIDTLSAGFSVVNRHLWLIAVPLVLDLIIWLGPQITVAPLAMRALEAYEKGIAVASAEAANAPSSLDKESMMEGGRQVAETAANFNLTALLAWQVPSLSLPPLGLMLWGARIDVGSALAFTIVLALLILGALLYAALYLGLVAGPVRGEPTTVGISVQRICSRGVSFLCYYALVGAALIPALMLLLLLGGLAALVSSALASLIGAVTSVLAVGAAVYLFFVDEAIFVGDQGPVQAVRSSVSLIWRNYWISLVLIFLVNFLLVGTHIAWGALAGTLPGAAVAMLGNGYIATGLTAAAMIFYRQRALGW